MKQVFLAFALICGLLFSPLSALADPAVTMVTVGDTVIKSLSEIIDCGLPVLYIETVDGEEPTCDYVSAPPGCMGFSITNATKVPGRLAVYSRVNGEDCVLYDSGDYEKDVSGMTIKVRGNASAYDVKKPYKIKLQKKFDLLFGGNDSIYKDKEWLLLRDDYLTTLAGFKVNELVKMTWTPRHHYVNVVMNGSYRGAYLLCESVKRNPDCRINVDKTTGYIFECDPYWWNEDVYVTSLKSPAYNFTFKYPDSDDILPEQLDYMQWVVTDYENSLNNTNYPDKIDVVSFAAWCLAHDLMGTQDSGGANRYYYKYDNTDTSRIVMPVLWDFDMVERTTSQWSRCHTSHFDMLFNNSNRQFVDEFVAQWRRVKPTFYDDFVEAMNAFTSSAEGQALVASSALEYQRWNFDLEVLDCAGDRKYWYQARVEWIDPMINALNPIGDVNIDGKVEIADCTWLIDWLLDSDGPVMHAYDVNGNNVVSITDVTLLIDLLLSGH